jgi:hypothetical protein
MRNRGVRTLAITAIVLLGACGGSSNNSSSSGSSTVLPTTTATSSSTVPSNKGFEVQTDDGQVSLSLNGQLPPDWPASFPLPSGATPAGSGSLVKGGSGVIVGVFTTSQAPGDVYDFYKTSSALTIGSARSAGVGSAYVGRLELTGSHTGHVTIVALNGTTTIIVTLKPASPTTTTTPKAATTVTTTPTPPPTTIKT